MNDPRALATSPYASRDSSRAKAFFNSNHPWLTAPFTCFGIFRFLELVSGRAGRGRKSELPTQEMLHDLPFVLNVAAWAIVVVAIVYQVRPGGR